MELGRRFAALDMGSNAMRLLFARVFRHDDERLDALKEAMFRMPLRLGEESFRDGVISDATADRLLHTMKAYRHLVDAWEPEGFRACATSAMRQAENGPALVKHIRKEAGIELEIIDGPEEARIIFANHSASALPRKSPVLFVDVGGGSTELTLFRKGKPRASASFPIGTVRLLHGKVKEKRWDEMKGWLHEEARAFEGLEAVGSGGNINKIFNLAGLKQDKPISRPLIEHVALTLEPYSVEERVRDLGLRPDRADVILHASRIYLSVMKWSGAKLMHVPQAGLADGLVREMAVDAGV